jgi:MYXO-CTERM domain-containing protein
MKKVSISSPTSSKTLAAGSASIAALLSASAANATIIYFNPETKITSGNSASGDVSWNIDGVGGAEAKLNNSGSITNSFAKILSSYDNSFAVVLAGPRDLLGLAANESISSERGFSSVVYEVFYNGFLENTASISSGVSTYIGFRFNPSGTKELFGWANVTLTEGGSYGTFVINEWAYDDSGSSIQTGQTSAVPEPATYALGLGALALGAAGLRRMRQRKRLAA